MLALIRKVDGLAFETFIAICFATSFANRCQISNTQKNGIFMELISVYFFKTSSEKFDFSFWKVDREGHRTFSFGNYSTLNTLRFMWNTVGPHKVSNSEKSNFLHFLKTKIKAFLINKQIRCDLLKTEGFLANNPTISAKLRRMANSQVVKAEDSL